MIIPDASVAAALLLRQPAADVLRGWVRSAQLEEARAREVLEDSELLGITWYPERPLLRLAWSLRDNASAHDAIYLALGHSHSDGADQARVLTLDRRLARAFPQSTVVPG